jgi:hypothetical protein
MSVNGYMSMVACNVCEKRGHCISVFSTSAMGGLNRETLMMMCTLCGMTLSEIRGEVKEPEPEPVNA